MSFHFGLLGLHVLSFWPFGPSFPFILACWAFISFHFSLLGLHFLSFWPFGPSLSFILAFWPFISFHFGLLGFHFLSFWPWPFGLFISLCFQEHLAQICHPSLSKMVTSSKQIQPKNCFQNWSFWLFGPSFPFILAFWAFISCHFGLLGLHFLSFWPFGPSFLSFWPFGLSFPFILAFWALISFHFGLLGFSFPCVFKKPLAQICHPSLSKMVTSSKQIQPKNCLQNWSFWPFGPSFPFILVFWAFICFHFGLLGLHFLSFWPFGP